MATATPPALFFLNPRGRISHCFKPNTLNYQFLEETPWQLQHEAMGESHGEATFVNSRHSFKLKYVILPQTTFMKLSSIIKSLSHLCQSQSSPKKAIPSLIKPT